MDSHLFLKNKIKKEGGQKDIGKNLVSKPNVINRLVSCILMYKKKLKKIK